MSKFKVGDRVRTIWGEYVVDRIDGAKVYYVSGGYDYEKDVQLVKAAIKSLDSLAVDDVVVDDSGTEYTVATVDGRVIHLEDGNGHLVDAWSIKQLKDNDYTVKQNEPETVEVTLEEVAKLKGVSVDKIRIKDGE